MLDNLKAHKSPRVAEILARKNCSVRYLPPYSPDFNPIEMAISKLKAALRKLAERTLAGLIAVLESCAGLFKRDECENYFETCGYEPAELPLRVHNLNGFRSNLTVPKKELRLAKAASAARGRTRLERRALSGWKARAAPILPAAGSSAGAARTGCCGSAARVADARSTP